MDEERVRVAQNTLSPKAEAGESKVILTGNTMRGNGLAA